MIDPMWIALFGTLLGTILPALLIWLIETHVSLYGVPAPKNYDLRWQDLEYVKMIHRTRDLEKEAGVSLSECKCWLHKGPRPGAECGFMGCGAVECDKVCSVLQKDKRAKLPIGPAPGAKINSTRTDGSVINTGGIQTRGPIYYNYFNIKGYQFKIDANKVPANAYGEWDDAMGYGVFRWMDATTGKQMMLKALPQMEFAPADYIDIYSDQSNKPVLTYRPRVSDKTTVKKEYE